MHTSRLLLLLLAFATFAPCASAWEARGEPGLVRVDPDTRLAYVVRDGRVQRLWDGVYPMEDGSLLTVRAGVAVRNRPMVEAEPQYHPGRSCRMLVEWVCGPAGQCAEREDCSLARQLQAMDSDEIAQSRDPGVRTHADWQCSSTYHDSGVLRACDLGAGRL